LIAQRRRHPTRPLRHRYGYPAALHRSLPSTKRKASGSSPTHHQKMAGIGCASPPAPIRQVRAGVILRGVNAGSSRIPFRHAHRAPHHLAVLTRPGFVGAACHPNPASPRPGCPSFAVLLRQNHGRGLSPPLNQCARHGALVNDHTRLRQHHIAAITSIGVVGIDSRRTQHTGTT